MRIQQIKKDHNRKNNQISPNYKGVLDGAITTTLRTLDTNPMANAVGVDLFAMVAPRTYVDTKERNKYAGAETFFREFTGTLIVCLSASLFAKGISKIANKLVNPKVKINTNSWFSKDSLDVLSSAFKKSNNATDVYVKNVLNNVSGKDVNSVNHYKKIDWSKIEWVDEKRWSRIKWDNKKYSDIQDKLKSEQGINSVITELIENKNITHKDRKDLISITSSRIVNALGANNVSVNFADKTLSTNIPNLVRDMVDMGKDVFRTEGVNPDAALSKINKINNIKSVGALSLASILGLSNQYINRKITEKRTGTKGFVGDVNYKNKVKDKSSSTDKSKLFFAEKLLVSAGMAAMALGVMKVKSPKDFIKKLEFTGPITSGNAIKTVYASTLIGRFMASDSHDELRESATRDYLGFLNWLVFGGFAAKGVANLLDPKRKNLFNHNKEGKGFKHWLNDLSLKSHNEIAAKGEKFAKKNMWKLNLAHTAGLVYSTVALGVLLPKLNILITKMKQNNNKNEKGTSLNVNTNRNLQNKFDTLNSFRTKYQNKTLHA